MKILILILVLLFNTQAYGGQISSPPPLKDMPVSLQHYLKQLYNNFYILEVVTTAPNGSKNGNKGQMVIYNNSGTFSLWVNTTSSTVWQQI